MIGLGLILTHHVHFLSGMKPEYTWRKPTTFFRALTNSVHQKYLFFSIDLQTFVMSALNTHNMLRDMHGVPALRLSENLSQAALGKTSPDERGAMVRSEAGMNVFDICEGTISGTAVTKEW